MFLKVVIYRSVAFTHSNTQKNITELTQKYAWEWAFKSIISNCRQPAFANAASLDSTRWTTNLTRWEWAFKSIISNCRQPAFANAASLDSTRWTTNLARNIWWINCGTNDQFQIILVNKIDDVKCNSRGSLDVFVTLWDLKMDVGMLLTIDGEMK